MAESKIGMPAMQPYNTKALPLGAYDAILETAVNACHFKFTIF
jgi:hypothetical protein